MVELGGVGGMVVLLAGRWGWMGLVVLGLMMGGRDVEGEEGRYGSWDIYVDCWVWGW